MSEILRALIDTRDRAIQKSRIAFDNRILAIRQGRDHAENDIEELIEKWADRFREMEDDINDDIETIAKTIPIINLMTEIKGVGKMLAAKIIALVDIERADTVSALWRYCGFGVVDGKSERRTKGETLSYNSRLKTYCYLIGKSFLMSGSPYRSIYDSAKEYYKANREEWTDLHIHNAAMRKMIKIWLSHLWLTWRKLESLEITGPYVEAKLGHNHIRAPQDFGWPAMD